MTDSIFLDVKNFLEVEESFTGFDAKIRLAINSAIADLNQIGIGPEDGLIITGSDEGWNQLVGTATDYESVKLFICLKVRLVFDPPSSSFILEAINKQITQLEWRLNIQVETDLTKPTPT